MMDTNQIDSSKSILWQYGRTNYFVRLLQSKDDVVKRMIEDAWNKFRDLLFFVHRKDWFDDPYVSNNDREFALWLWGLIIGMPRPRTAQGPVSLKLYRQLLVAYNYRLFHDASLASLNKYFSLLFDIGAGSSQPNKTMLIQDSGDMSIGYFLNFTPTVDERTLFEASGVCPHPVGVEITTSRRASLRLNDKIFGFNGLYTSHINPIRVYSLGVRYWYVVESETKKRLSAIDPFYGPNGEECSYDISRDDYYYYEKDAQGVQTTRWASDRDVTIYDEVPGGEHRSEVFFSPPGELVYTSNGSLQICSTPWFYDNDEKRAYGKQPYRWYCQTEDGERIASSPFYTEDGTKYIYDEEQCNYYYMLGEEKRWATDEGEKMFLEPIIPSTPTAVRTEVFHEESAWHQMLNANDGKGWYYEDGESTKVYPFIGDVGQSLGVFEQSRFSEGEAKSQDYTGFTIAIQDEDLEDNGYKFEIIYTGWNTTDGIVIEWGDGSTSIVKATVIGNHTAGGSFSKATHYYKTAGVFSIKMYKGLWWFRVGNNDSKDDSKGPADSQAMRDKVVSVDRWSSDFMNGFRTYSRCSNLSGILPAWGQSMFSCEAVYEYTNLSKSPSVLPSNMSTMVWMYGECSNLVGPISVLPQGKMYSYSLSSKGALVETETSGKCANAYLHDSKLVEIRGSMDADVIMPVRFFDNPSGYVTGASEAVRKKFFSSWGGTNEEVENVQYIKFEALENCAPQFEITILPKPIVDGEGDFEPIVIDWGDGNFYGFSKSFKEEKAIFKDNPKWLASTENPAGKVHTYRQQINKGDTRTICITNHTRGVTFSITQAEANVKIVAVSELVTRV